MKKFIVPGVAALGVVAGIAGANIAASAESTTNTTNSGTSSSTSTTGSTSTNTPQSAPSGSHQYNGKIETALTGTDLEKATAAAKAKVSGGTVVRAETDVDGDGTYEVHMQTSDGKQVTVFLDSSFNVTSQTDGMSAKNPGPSRDQQSSSGTSTSSSTSN